MGISFSLAKLAKHTDSQLKGDPDCRIRGIAALDQAVPGQISFLHKAAYRSFLKITAASAVILSDQDSPFYSGNALIAQDPYLAYAQVADLFAPKDTQAPGVHPSVVLGKRTLIHESATVSPGCVIGNQVTIGAHAVIGANCVIGSDSTIGDHTLLHPNVTLYPNVRIGKQAVIHSGTVIGSDGFGMVRKHDRSWYKIPQLGGVRIADAVEIGSNVSIDCGALHDTRIEEGVKMDNLIQIGHNVRIGKHTVIAGGTLIAGSADIGAYCMIGGGCAISGHLCIADHVHITGRTNVASSIAKAGVYSSGLPAQPNHQWKKNIVRFLQLDHFVRRLKKLEKTR